MIMVRWFSWCHLWWCNDDVTCDDGDDDVTCDDGDDDVTCDDSDDDVSCDHVTCDDDVTWADDVNCDDDDDDENRRTTKLSTVGSSGSALSKNVCFVCHGRLFV